MVAANVFCILLLLLLLTASSVSSGSPKTTSEDVDSLALVIDNLADLANTELNFVSDFMMDDQRRVGSLRNLPI